MPKKTDDAVDKKKAKSSKKTSSASSPKSPKPRKGTPRKDGREPDGKFTKHVSNAWKPGQSGNPAGRPKHRTLSEAIRDKLRQETGVETDETWADLIADRLVRVAAGVHLGNSTEAAKEIGDRTEGRPRQPIDIDIVADARKTIANLLGRPVDELPAPRGND